MNRKISEEDKKFIKDNWYTMRNLEMAKRFNVSVQAITNIGRKMGLQNKREIIDELGIDVNDLEEVKKYKDSWEEKIETEGRKKKLQLRYIKEQIEKKNSLKIRIKEERGSRILNGSIVQMTDELVVLQIGKYTESFKYVEFFTGRAVIV